MCWNVNDLQTEWKKEALERSYGGLHGMQTEEIFFDKRIKEKSSLCNVTVLCIRFS
jgi:hypothetical protein